MARRVVPGHPDCPADTSVALVNDATGEEVVEECYPDEESAQAALDAADLADGEGASILDPVVAQTYGAHSLPIEAYSLGNWEGILTIEGAPSGDRREFDVGALEWRDLPLTMYWQIMTAPEHMQSVAVARIDEMWRDGGDIRAKGVFDVAGEHGAEAHRLVHGGFIRGQSVSLDDISDNDVEMIFPEPDPDAEASDEISIEDLFMEPEKILFHHGRVMDSLLTGQPAFQEAYITLVPDDQYADQSSNPDANSNDGASGGFSQRNSRAVPVHATAFYDAPWNAETTFANVPINVSPEFAHLCFAWIDRDTVNDGEMPKQAGKFLHHGVSPNGMPGPANLTAVSASIGQLNGSRGGTDIPDEDRREVYEHLAQHLRDAGQQPPPLVSLEDAQALRVLTASLVTMTDPPQSWFTDPKFREATPWTVEDNGHAFGHLALWHTCHTAFTGACITPPRESEFAYYTTGEIVAKEGSRWPVGQITFGTNHAPGHLGARPASEHYEHTGFAAADVAAGADKHGIWVSGAVRPGLTEGQMRSLRAAAISGDWRRIGGKLRLVAGLLVNVPGFPVPRLKTYVHDGAQSALVASGIVPMNMKPRVRSDVALRIAKSIGRDPASRRAELLSRVHGS